MLDLNNLKFKVTEICDNIITVNLTELSNDKDAEEVLLHLRAVAYLDKDKYHKCHLKFSSEWDDGSIELVTVIGTRYKTESEMIIHKASVIRAVS